MNSPVRRLRTSDLAAVILERWPGYSSEKKIPAVWGIPRGGWNIAALMQSLAIAIQVDTPDEADMIVDDIIDSGRMRDTHKSLYPEKPFWAPFDKTTERDKHLAWVEFPWETGKTDDLKDIVTRLIQHIGDDPTREGLRDTPKRVVKMYREIFRGYARMMRPEVTTFPNGGDGIKYDQIIADEGKYYSQCEHHMVPFFGNYWFGYIPSPTGKVLGLSKVARVVDYFSAKLQVQERLGQEILDYLEEKLGENLGMIIVMRGQHLCKCMRGVRKEGFMTTSVVRGVFKDAAVKQEFMSMIKLGV